MKSLLAFFFAVFGSPAEVSALAFNAAAPFFASSRSLSPGINGRREFQRPTVLSMAVEESASKKLINVGVIGCGRIGLVHLGAITKAPGVKAVIVSNPTLSKAEAGEHFP
mmetsp:Transcript_6099/g.13132  ORF Transcript_6099/g.13132 Transcript_6099/m.13132 type:complete len:110 (-) Transcript_6099:1700-2029(-)